MTQRITKQMLKARVDYLNKITGNDVRPWSRDENGNAVAHVGNYHLSGAYGGWTLHETVTQGGGVHDVFPGYMTKRELYGLINAFIAGIERHRQHTDRELAKLGY